MERAAEQAAGGSGRQFRWKDYLVYYLGYTVLFGLMAAAVFIWFWVKRRRFVWQTDGVNQHYYGLVYFSRWGKEVLRQFRETGVLRLPTFSLRMGYGEDLYTTLAYYVIGDPFSLPAVFVPERFLLLFHDLMLLARFYLAGITFSAWCFYMKRRSRPGVMAGAFIYIFNAFTLSGMRHHYFLNPFVFFPLLLIGCERIFRKKKPGLFIFMVFVSAVSNFYFFYMMVLMTVLYAVWRSLRLRGLRHLGRVVLDGISFVWYGLSGTLLAAFVFLPVVLRFLQDPRAAEGKSIPLLWPLRYYRYFLDCFLTGSTSALSESWTYMGFGAVAALCILFLFVQRKKHFDLKAAFVGLTCLLLTPAAAYVLNGFSYPANRWMFAYALLTGVIAATAIPEMVEDAGTGQLLASLLLLAAYVAVCTAWQYTFARASAQGVMLALFGLAAVLYGRLWLLEREKDLPASCDASMKQSLKRKMSVRVQAVLLACVLLTVAGEAYYSFSTDRNAKVFEYLSRAQIETQTAKDAAAAAELIDGQLRDQSFYRYTTYNPENNTSLLYGVSNTQYYWSLSNTSITRFFNETGQLNRMIHLYDTLDDRTFLNEIAGIKYFLGNDKDGLPWGYQKVEGLSYSNEGLWADTEGLDRFSCEVYENMYALPFGFTSGRWISREDYEALDIPQRQEALMQGILLEQDPGEDFTRLERAEEAGDSVTSVETGETAGPGGKTAAGASGETAGPAGKTAAGALTAAGAAASGGSMAEEASAGRNLLRFTDRRIPVRIEYDGTRVTAEGLAEAGDAAAEGTPAEGTAAPGIAAEDSPASGAGTGTMAGTMDNGPVAFHVAEDCSDVTLRFAGLPDCETSLYIRGLSYAPPAGTEGPTKFLLSVRGCEGENTVASKQIGFTTPADPWTTGRTDYMVNMLYRDKALDRFVLSFPMAGTYTIDSIEVVCQPMTDYPAQANAFRAETLTDLDIHEMGESSATEQITGHIELDAPRILCLQIPRTAGWTAYVDGTRAELLQADTMFSALLLPAGSHEIDLRYQTPGLRLGAVISAGTFVLIVLFSVIYAIVSAILGHREQRRAQIPAGTFEAIAEPAAEGIRPEESSVEEEEAPPEEEASAL